MKNYLKLLSHLSQLKNKLNSLSSFLFVGSLSDRADIGQEDGATESIFLLFYI